MSMSSSTRSEATVTVAPVRPTASTLVTLPWNSTIEPSGGAPQPVRKARSRRSVQPSSAPRWIASSAGTPPIVSPGRAAMVTCCSSTSSPTAHLKASPSTSSELARKVVPPSVIGTSALVSVSTVPPRRASV